MFFAIGNLLWFVIAVALGTVVSALTVIAAKQFTKRPVTAPEAPALATT